MTLPLFVVIIAVAMIGVAAGGMATWFRQGHWRRAARQHEADARQARSQLADLRANASIARRAAAAFGAASRAVFTGPPGETSRARRCRTRPVTTLSKPRFRGPEGTMSLLVKICGLSTRETLDVALAAGADMVGFVFFPPSPRHLALEAARELGRRRRAARQKWR